MDQEMTDLKSVLRSLVVSSPTQMDVRSLLRDYRNMMGSPIPLAKYGFRDPLEFLKERCGDCFLFTGPASNPVLTLIVPETLKHIDQFVQRQKLSSTVKHKGKRRSVSEALIKKPQPNLIASTFISSSIRNKPINEDPVKSNLKPLIKNGETQVKEQPNNQSYKPEIKTTSNCNISVSNKENEQHNSVNKLRAAEHEYCSTEAYQNFLKKRLPPYSENEKCDEKTSSKDDGDSGRQTASSTSSTKAAKLEELKNEIMDLISEFPEGVWCTELIRLYRERYRRELDFIRFGFTSILSVVAALGPGVVESRDPEGGDWLVRDARYVPRVPRVPHECPGPARVRARSRPHLARPVSCTSPVDPDDALPGIDFDPDVFPSDCMHFMDSIPGASLAGLAAGAMLEVLVGEVYSPSHFWVLRLGERHHAAMEDIMDQMTRYYSHGEGRARALSLGAVRVGHYCSSVYEGDWHRSLIVRILDSETVKVRHVDYGTVETVRVSALKPLRREWGQLPAQAVRARLAGVRPCGRGRRWPHAASAAFLRAVRDTRLVANLVCQDPQEDIIEVFLINTSTEEDINISNELIRSGHADGRPDSSLRTSECYLFPRFEALEGGDTPNYGEIARYLRDGIRLEFVDEYRRHVPADLPPLASPHTTPPPAPPTPSPTPPSLSPSPSASPSPTPPESTESAGSSAERMRASAPVFEPASLAARAESPPPSRPAPPDTFNRIPLMQPQPAQELRPQPPPPRPPPPPPQQAYSPMMPYVGMPPFPGAVPLYPPLYPPPMPVFVPGPPGPPGFAPQPGPYPHAPRQTARPPGPNRWASPRAASPPPPYNGSPNVRQSPSPAPTPTRAGGRGDVTLSVSECEIFRLLSRVDPGAAQWYMADAISRALRSPAPAPTSSLNPEAAEFRLVASGTQTDLPRIPLPPGMRPPPGFER
ncbi:hypothetical protein evm_002429 [Chilo suppressalis]|nr:hypothetical protein evm_002429 [Chilo suppressalis]